MFVPNAIVLALFLLICGLVGALVWALRRPQIAPLVRDFDGTDSVEKEFSRIAGIHSYDGLAILDLNGVILWVNAAYCTMMERTAEEMIGRNPLSFALTPEDALTETEIAQYRIDPENSVYNRLGVEETSLYSNATKSGRQFWNQISQSVHTTEAGQKLVVQACRDVTEQIEKEARLHEASARLEHSATHDNLTGAANRSKLMEFVTGALADAKKAGLSVGLLQIDLDRFKEINDVHGHSAGDAVLQHVASQTHGVLRKSDLLARMGGDEFVVVCTDLTSMDALRTIGTDIRDALRQPFPWEDTELSCDASIGAALTKSSSDTLEDLLRNSDFALYDVKKRGRGAVAVYDAKLDRRQKRLSRRASDLAEAVRTGRIQYHFQPYADIDTGEILGFETLARWSHPEDGLLHPRDFLPLAIDLGLMVQIDFLAFRAANRMRERLKEQGHDHIGVNINCSGSTLSHPDFRPMLKKDLAKRGLSPSDLTLEVREAVIFDGDEGRQSHTQRIHDLRNDGFPILLDDFAAGYRGLTHLNQLPIAGFKIERAVINDILDDPTNRKVAGMILELSADLGLIAVSEGIETIEQAIKVKEIGGQIIQGHLISPALPTAQVLPWLAQRPTVPWPVPSAIAPDDDPRYLRANS